MGRTSDARARLMNAAYDMISEHSYGAVTVDAICERAGVKKGSFYHFFDSKSDLAIAAIDAWWAERKAILDEIFRPEVAPVDRLRGYLNFISQRQISVYQATGQILGCPLFTLGAEISTQNECIRLRICNFLDCMLVYVKQAIADAQALGEIEGGDADAKAHSFLAYYEGVLTRGRIENNPAPILRLSADTLEAIGVRTALASA
jgi:TetR/AcrR family transcriptional repressor of nem operon